MDRNGFQDWLDRYVEAWKSYDPQQIGDLFSENAEYRYHPQDEPVRGRDAIVADWTESKDEPGTYDAKYEPAAIDGDTFVATGHSDYLDADGKMTDQYLNVYFIKFDEQGRATHFTEYWIQNRDFRKRALDEMKAKAVEEAATGETDGAAA
jgi:hypothetical protein